MEKVAVLPNCLSRCADAHKNTKIERVRGGIAECVASVFTRRERWRRKMEVGRLPIASSPVICPASMDKDGQGWMGFLTIPITRAKPVRNKAVVCRRCRSVEVKAINSQ
jgi:hypothetical protein